MSKAFTKENDQPADEDLPDDPSLNLAPGQKNYITPAGARRLEDELNNLHRVVRPEVVRVVAWAAGNGDRSENADYIYGKRRLREIDRRMRFLTRRLDLAEIVEVNPKATDQVRFGATVVVGNETGDKKTFRIVGVDEIDLAKGHVSWVSPIGKTLLQAKVGDVVLLRAPKGDQELEILEIRYEAL